MGFTYAVINGRERLCCDFCGGYAGDFRATKTVRKVRCPYGYCQSWSVCNICKKEGKHKRSSCGFDHELSKDHRGCKIEADRYMLMEAEKQALLAQGYYLRCSASMTQDNSMVQVTFRNKEGQEKLIVMTQETYRSIPLGTNATIEDYHIQESA